MVALNAKKPFAGCTCQKSDYCKIDRSVFLGDEKKTPWRKFLSSHRSINVNQLKIKKKGEWCEQEMVKVQEN